MTQHANRSCSFRGNQPKNLVFNEVPSFSLGLTQDEDFNMGSTNILSKEGVTIEEKKDCVVQAQLERCIMSLEKKESSTSCIGICAKGTILHFTLIEFALVTGLNCVTNRDDFVFDKEQPNRIIDQYFDAKKKLKPHPKGVDEQTPKRTPPPRAARIPSVRTPIHNPIQTKTTIRANRKDINRPDSKKTISVQSPTPFSFSSEDEDVVVSKKMFDKFHDKVTKEMEGNQSNSMNDVYNGIDGYNEDNDDVLIFIQFIQNKEAVVEMNLTKPAEDESEVNDVDKSKLDQQHKTPVHIHNEVNDESNADQDLPDSQITFLDEVLPSLNANNKEEHYLKGKAKIPLISFGILSVEDKNWFYIMGTPNQTWSDEKSKYDSNSSYTFSTVDCNFMNIVRRVFDMYKVDDASLTDVGKEYHLHEYISRFRMHATVPWHTVDHIFIFVHVKAKRHWVLVVISFNHRCIYVYDSLSAADYDAVVLNKIEKLAKVIPICFIAYKFYENKGIDIDNHPNYKLNKKIDLFGILVVENVPQQLSGSLDCGLYMVMYAECLNFGERVPSIDFDPDLIRIRYASLLWDYATRKVEMEA
ncbi:hypothetical protein FXO38_17981 [Capsicum annuum]|nr:hypothetical protein FXO38_17981 [Capsicum annuum]